LRHEVTTPPPILLKTLRRNGAIPLLPSVCLYGAERENLHSNFPLRNYTPHPMVKSIFKDAYDHQIMSLLLHGRKSLIERENILELRSVYVVICRPQRGHGLRRGTAAAHLLGLWFQNPPEAWMFVSCECLCVVRQRSLRRADHSSRGVLPSVACV
jgi:hypothetical protein